MVSCYFSAPRVLLKFPMKTGWRLYAPQQQADLDAFSQSGATEFQINIRGNMYEINLTSGKQINRANNRKKTMQLKHDFPNVGGNSTLQPSGAPLITRQAPSIISQPPLPS